MSKTTENQIDPYRDPCPSLVANLERENLRLATMLNSVNQKTKKHSNENVKVWKTTGISVIGGTTGLYACFSACASGIADYNIYWHPRILTFLLGLDLIVIVIIALFLNLGE